MFLRNMFTLMAALVSLWSEVVLRTQVANALGNTTPSTLRRRLTPEEVTFAPGEGLPSLESLGHPSLGLAEHALDEIEDEEAAAANSTVPSIRRRLSCRAINGAKDRVYRAAKRACASYLEALGNTTCVTNPWFVSFCDITIGTSNQRTAV